MDEAQARAASRPIGRRQRRKARWAGFPRSRDAGSGRVPSTRARRSAGSAGTARSPRPAAGCRS